MTSVAMLNRDIAAKRERAERMQAKDLKSDTLFAQEDAPFDAPAPAAAPPAAAPKTGELLDAPNPAMFVAPDLTQSLARFMLPDTAIAKMREEFLPLTINGTEDKAGFKRVDAARKLVKGHRCDVEKTRKDLKAEALKFGQAVDSEAKRITALLEPIELHLETEQKRVTDELARIQREKEEAERAKAEEEARKIREAEEAKIREAHEAEEKRLAAEREKLAAERREQEERDRVEREKIDAERREIEEARRKLADEQARVDAEKKRLADEEAARQLAEREREESERRRLADEAYAEKRAAEIEAARPDKATIGLLGSAILALRMPDTKTEKAQQFVASVMEELSSLADKCHQWQA